MTLMFKYGECSGFLIVEHRREFGAWPVHSATERINSTENGSYVGRDLD